jgi:oligosaccharide amylase
MPKLFMLGNGHLMIGLDEYGQVYDLYYPNIGHEHHMSGELVHRIGVYVDGSLSWFDDGSWNIQITCSAETLSSTVEATNESKQISVTFNDVVYNEKDIFIRHITVKNLASQKRQVKLYLGHQFQIYESQRGDTAFFDPLQDVIIHYKGRRIFLINTFQEKPGIEDYSIGLFGIEGKEGTFKDAEDGNLTQNPIEHGSVDSIIGVTMDINGSGSEAFYYWICASKTFGDVYDLNQYVIRKQPAYLIETTQNYWKAWVNKQNFSFYGLNEPAVALFKKSLLLIRAHIDENGAIIASGDSDLLKNGRDMYSYVWPRDAAFTAIALNKAGYSQVAKSFLSFANDVINPNGYFMHKYLPDKSLGSSWHPWVRNGKIHLPIQEDETALVIIALWEYYASTKDLEFIESVYNSLIRKAAEFMVSYIDDETGLPKPSYDLWEEKYGTTTFTSSAVYAALLAASRFSGILGKSTQELTYKTFAEKIKNAIFENLYGKKEGYFYKSIINNESKIIVDKTLDMSSIYALYRFGVVEDDNKYLDKSIKAVENKLLCNTEVGGVARNESDYYFRMSHDVPGNPWIITTLWLAQYYILRAKDEKDLDKVSEWIDWTVRHALPSGALSEQLHPHTGQQLSASPLTWSHSEYVFTILSYLEKLEEFGICKLTLPIEGEK